jgi:hypothetical protein
MTKRQFSGPLPPGGNEKGFFKKGVLIKEKQNTRLSSYPIL